jgi:hypothetical protein
MADTGVEGGIDLLHACRVAAAVRVELEGQPTSRRPKCGEIGRPVEAEHRERVAAGHPYCRARSSA